MKGRPSTLCRPQSKLARDELLRPLLGQPTIRNRVRILPDFILKVGTIFVDLVGIDGTTIFQMDHFRRSAVCGRD